MRSISIQTSKKLAAVRQISGAVEHFRKQEFECAVTLALAAEGLLPNTNDPHLFKDLKDALTSKEFKELGANLLGNWLKHPDGGPDEIEIREFDGVLAIERAITKFIAAYHQSTGLFEAFLKWCKANGYPAPGSE